jgi:hypothetical protein
MPSSRVVHKELIDLGDRLLMLGRMKCTGEASGIAVDTEVTVLITLKNGKVIREEQYAEPAEAGGLSSAR